jgi:Flp pilus assembly protein TadD
MSTVGGSKLRGAPRFAMTAAALSLSVMLGACSQGSGLNLGLGSDQPKTADIATASATLSTEAELAKATTYWGEQHQKHPNDPKAAVNYARNLKAMGRKPNALSALQTTYAYASNDKELLSEYGRLALDLGQVSTAEKLLMQAEDPAKPDWRLISARGTVLAKQGRFSESIPFFEKALALAPEQPSLMNNLAMAYTMNGEAARGEALLRRAADSGINDVRVQKNLELVMGLQGKGADGAQPTVARASAATASRPPAQNASWDRALPIEQGEARRPATTAPLKTASSDRTAAAPLGEDELVRRALEAEHAKRSRQ